MSHAIIASSQMRSYSRLDARFHIAIASIAELMDAERPTFDAATWVPRMKALPNYAREPIKPLLRGQQTIDRDASRVIEYYPLEAYCLIKQGIAAAKKERDRRVRAVREIGQSLDVFN